MKFYNREVKERFIEETASKDNTKRAYSYLLSWATVTEEIEEKDLYNFNLFEIANVVKNKQPKSLTDAKWKVYSIRKYIDWAIKHQYRDNVINPLDGVTEEWIRELVDWKAKTMFTKEEIFGDILEKLVNAQDKALIVLLFEGAWGENGSELANLREEDVNWETCEITLRTNEYTERTIRVDKQTIDILRDANTQRYYHFNNGIKRGKNGANGRDLKFSSYILKNVVSINNTGSNPIKIYTMRNKLTAIRDSLALEALNMRSVRASGVLSYAYDLLEERGKLTKTEYNMIGDKYGYSKIKANGHEYYSRSTIAKTVNSDNMMSYYGLEIPDDTQ